MSAPTRDRPAPMTLWRLERLRLLRTHRWMLLVGVYGVLAVLSAVTARYLRELMARFGEGMTIEGADPRPADGIGQFVSNTSQLGVLAVVVVATGALALDAKPELAAFLRTKVSRAAVLLVPAYAITTAGAVVALVIGTAVVWALTHVLIGPLPAGPMAVGTMYGALYLAFAVAVVAAVAGFTRSQTATVFGALGVLLLLPVAGTVDAVGVWLPSELLGAVAALVDGAPAGDFARAAVVSVTATAALLALAAWRLERREL